MSKTLRKDRFYPYPPEDVWVALTDPRAIAEWLMPNTFEPKLGHRFRFETDPMPMCEARTECEVIELDPPRRLAYLWTIVPKNPDKPKCPPMTVSWTLIPEAGGTRLVLEQTNLEAINVWWRLSMRFGWGHMMKRLIPKVLANVKDGRFTPGAIPLEKRIYKAKSIPDDLVV